MAPQRAGRRLLAFGGRFVENQQVRRLQQHQLGLFPFRRRLTFCRPKDSRLSVTQPDRVRELLATVFKLTADGVLTAPQYSYRWPGGDASSGGEQRRAPLKLIARRTA